MTAVGADAIRRVRRGRGFEYRAADGTRITSETQLQRFRDLVIPPAWNDVYIAHSPDAKVLATGVDADGRTQYRYHPSWIAAAAEEKFARALDLADVLPRARQGVTRDLRRGTTERRVVLAAAFRILDSALVRIGSESYEQTHKTVGVSTLRCRHVRLADADIGLRFRAKGGLRWDSELHDPDLAAVLGLLAARGPGRRLLAWHDEAGWHPLRAPDVNADVRERTGGEFTAKDFRTLHGTLEAARSLAACGPQDDAKAHAAAVHAAVRAAATALGNTESVARSSYIDPRLFEAYERGDVLAGGRRAGVTGLRKLLEA